MYGVKRKVVFEEKSLDFLPPGYLLVLDTKNKRLSLGPGGGWGARCPRMLSKMGGEDHLHSQELGKISKNEMQQKGCKSATGGTNWDTPPRGIRPQTQKETNFNRRVQVLKRPGKRWTEIGGESRGKGIRVKTQGRKGSSEEALGKRVVKRGVTKYLRKNGWTSTTHKESNPRSNLNRTPGGVRRQQVG